MANLDYKFAGNQFGVTTEPLDYSHPQSPTEKTYHGIALVANGNVLGRIQNWNNAGAFKREAILVHELNNMTYGRPVDVIPGKSTGYTIMATMLEMWGKELEYQLGFARRFIDLVSQTTPFTAQEFWHRGINPYETWTYLGCWLTDMDKSDMNVGGDTRVITNVGFMYAAKVHTLHSA